VDNQDKIDKVKILWALLQLPNLTLNCFARNPADAGGSKIGILLEPMIHHLSQVGEVYIAWWNPMANRLNGTLGVFRFAPVLPWPVPVPRPSGAHHKHAALVDREGQLRFERSLPGFGRA
jgi:hypothetical protein